MSFAELRRQRAVRAAPWAASRLPGAASSAPGVEPVGSWADTRQASDPIRHPSAPGAPTYPELGDRLGVSDTPRGRGIFAKSSAHPGDTLLIAETHVSVLATAHIFTRCHYCFAQRPALLRCAGCRFARYCNAACQRTAWTEARHRDECAALMRWFACVPGGGDGSDLPDVTQEPGASVRALAQLLWQRRRRGRDSGWWRRVAAMQSHRRDMDAAQAADAAQLAVRLARFLGDGALEALGISHADALVTLIAQHHTNAFTLSDAHFDPIGVAVCPVAALINHSCAPNAVVVFPEACAGKRCPMHVVALTDIAAGDEIYASYVDIGAPRTERQRTLHERYHFTCNCALCSRTNWVDPRTALWCPAGCGAWCAGDGAPVTRCARCGAPRHMNAATYTRLNEAAALSVRVTAAMHEGGALPTDDALHSALRDTLPWLCELAPPANASLWSLLHAAHVLAIERGAWDEATRLAMLVCAGIQARGARDARSALYPPHHPQRAVMLAALGRLLLLDAAQDAVTPAWLIERAPLPPPSPARAALAHAALTQAARESSGYPDVAALVRESLASHTP